MNTTQAKLSASLRYKLDNAYRNAESLLEGVVKSCERELKRDMPFAEHALLEDLWREANEAHRKVVEVRTYWKSLRER